MTRPHVFVSLALLGAASAAFAARRSDRDGLAWDPRESQSSLLRYQRGAKAGKTVYTGTRATLKKWGDQLVGLTRSSTTHTVFFRQPRGARLGLGLPGVGTSPATGEVDDCAVSVTLPDQWNSVMCSVVNQDPTGPDLLCSTRPMCADPLSAFAPQTWRSSAR